MKKIFLLTLFLTGCSGLQTRIDFVKQNQDYEKPFKQSGYVKGRNLNVQEFRSLLESLGYRESEKAK